MDWSVHTLVVVGRAIDAIGNKRSTQPSDGDPVAPGHAVPDDGVTRPTVLVVGTDDWAIEQAAGALAAAGSPVLRCHEPGQPAFPCNALLEGRTCPLDEGFDVVATIRARAGALPAPAEFGVVCGVRAGVPLVVAGLVSERPFGPWAAATVEQGGDLPSACREVASRPAGRRSVIANRSSEGARS